MGSSICGLRSRRGIEVELDHRFAEGAQGEFHQFKVLAGKGDADDGDGQQQGENDMDQGRIEAAADEPDAITKDRETAHAAPPGHYRSTKGRKHQAGQLEALEAKRNPHEGYAQHQPADQVAQGREQPAADEPDNIAEEVHGRKIGLYVIRPANASYGHTRRLWPTIYPFASTTLVQKAGNQCTRMDRVAFAAPSGKRSWTLR